MESLRCLQASQLAVFRWLALGSQASNAKMGGGAAQPLAPYKKLLASGILGRAVARMAGGTGQRAEGASVSVRMRERANETLLLTGWHA